MILFNISKMWLQMPREKIRNNDIIRRKTPYKIFIVHEVKTFLCLKYTYFWPVLLKLWLNLSINVTIKHSFIVLKFTQPKGKNKVNVIHYKSDATTILLYTLNYIYLSNLYEIYFVMQYLFGIYFHSKFCNRS